MKTTVNHNYFVKNNKHLHSIISSDKLILTNQKTSTTGHDVRFKSTDQTTLVPYEEVTSEMEFPKSSFKFKRTMNFLRFFNTNSKLQLQNKIFMKKFSNLPEREEIGIDFSNYPGYTYEENPLINKIEGRLNQADSDFQFTNKANYTNNGNIVINKVPVKNKTHSKLRSSLKMMKFKTKQRIQSQYDETMILEKMAQLDVDKEKDAKMFGILQSFIDTPLNTYVSVYGVSNPVFPDTKLEEKKSGAVSAANPSSSLESIQSYVSDMLTTKKVATPAVAIQVF